MEYRLTSSNTSLQPPQTIGPFLINNSEEFIDLNSFYRNYSRSAVKTSIYEFALESSFPKLVPNSLENSQRYITDLKILEDEVTYIAEMAALYVIDQQYRFSHDVIKEANDLLRRNDQYHYESEYLGFGYFLKHALQNGHLGANSFLSWLDKFVTQKKVVTSFILNEINLIRIYKNSQVQYIPRKFNITCTYLADNMISPKLIRLTGDFIRRLFMSDEWILDFGNFQLKVKMNYEINQYFNQLD